MAVMVMGGRVGEERKDVLFFSVVQADGWGGLE
jgi:hypothetical protein